MTQEEKNALWEKHRPYVEVLSQVNNSYVMVAELRERFLYISPNYDNFFDYIPDFSLMSIEEKGEIIDTCIHPDDEPLIVGLQERVFDFVYTLPVEERKNYKHIFELRVLGSGKKYIRVILQYHILEGAQGIESQVIDGPDINDYILLLGICDVSPDQNMDEPAKFRLVNYKTNEVINFPAFEHPDISLTQREVEVLNLVNEGMLSKEISGRLSISIHTVNRHRQNILEKMSADNVMEAINYGRKLGLIG
jgi:Response regulator containing a CheY-like receiver domain and an HTH DNA-binding domain